MATLVFKMRMSFLVLLFGLGMNAGVTAVEESQDEFKIRQVIAKFTDGVDSQDGEAPREALPSEGVIYGFTADAASLLKLEPATFADLHAEKRFGGEPREVSIDNLSITDGLLASASVFATNEDVFYNYRLVLVKLDSTWKILSVTQRSRPL